jgi:hypothetical protein
MIDTLSSPSRPHGMNVTPTFDETGGADGRTVGAD